MQVVPSAQVSAHTSAHLGHFATTIFHNKNYSHQKPSGHRETWEECAERVVKSIIVKDLDAAISNGRGSIAERVLKRVQHRQFMPGGRYLYSCGFPKQQVNSCFLFRAEDSKEGWGELFTKCTNSLMMGGGVGVDHTPIRPEGYLIKGLGGACTGPCSTANIVNEMGRYMRQGGSRRSAIWGMIQWWHPDVFKWIVVKKYPQILKEAKQRDFNFPAPLDMTNISVGLDDHFFRLYRDPHAAHTYRAWGQDHIRDHAWTMRVFWEVVRGMCEDGEPGFSIDIGEKKYNTLRNACTEVDTSDDGDMCNLGSFNLARFDTIDDFAEAIEDCVALNLCGSLESHLPMPYMEKVREKNRRLGLGLMGIHEWLLKRGYRYGPCDELDRWLAVYASSGCHANHYADRLGISRPVATRSIAPNGTISIVAETTSGIEPIFAAAYKRRYLEGKEWKAQYKVDEAARRLVAQGVDPADIEDAMTLAEEPERRVSFQAHLQSFVDHAIASTINLPPWGTTNNCESTLKSFGDTLMKYLPKIRGITAYPDGSRGGQPLTRVNYHEAVTQEGMEFVDNAEEGCRSGVCGT